MKLKFSVMLCSSIVISILVVCISVYAFNAFCTADENTCRATASVNGWGLVNGYYSVRARVDNVVDQDGAAFANGNNLSDSAVVDLESCSSGSAYASVSGFDANGNFHAKSDDAAF